MKSNRIKIKISKSLQAKILKGHPWVHFYQLQNRDVSGAPGDLGVIYDHRNRFLAVGLFDPCSDIRLRVLATKEPVPVDLAFFEERIRRAANLRAPLAQSGTSGFRLVHGENDGLPGLVIDRYGDTLAIKLYTEAWVPYLGLLKAALQTVVPVERMVLLLSRHVERTHSSDVSHGMILKGPPLDGSVLFNENSLVFEADIIEGQKTGFFFDQRENRDRIREQAEGLTVLNVFSYTGGFSVYSFAGGCESVTEVDVNGQALKAARENLMMNFPDRAQNENRYVQIQGDAFQVLSRLRHEKQLFDLVILDPPAFASRKSHKDNAFQAYLRLAKAGTHCTREGGLLFAASCSQPVSANDFYRAVSLGVRQTGRKEQVVFKARHALDHPINFQGGEYLKAGCFRIS